MPMKETSQEISTLASQVIQRWDVPGATLEELNKPECTVAGPFVSVHAYNRLLGDARRLAASCLGQDETAGGR